MAEEILISIRLEKEDNDKQIDQTTQRITNLQKATADLQKQQKDLIKTGQENSQAYLDNAKQIEINKQKINENVASRKNLITTIIAEDDSIKGLKIRNAELIKQRDSLSTTTAEGKNQIAAINQELDKNNETIQKNVSGLEKQKINIGNYKSALDGVLPGLGGFIDGVQGMTKAGLTFIATPLGLILAGIALALASVSAYFKGSEEGQNKFNKLAAIGSAILEQFMNVVEALGGAIVSAFEDPKKAVEDLWAAIKENLVNRIVGFIEFLPKLGEAIEQAFSGDFTGALKTTADAAGKVFLGVENITDKVVDLVNETAALVAQGISNGEKLAALNAKIDADERALIVDRAKTGLEVSKLREAALQQEGEARKKILLEAIALEEQLTAQEVGLAKTRRDLAQAELEANGDDKEAKKAVAEAQAALINAETTAFQNTLRFRKEIAAIDEATRKAAEEALKKEIAAQNQLSEIRLQDSIDSAKTIEERVSRETELEQFKSQQLLANAQLTETERQVIAEQSQEKINEIITAGNAQIIESEVELKDIRIQAANDTNQAIIANKDQEIQKEIEAHGVSVELLTQQQELRTESLNSRVQAELDAETNRVAGLLASTTLLEEQKNVIEEESALKTSQIIAKGAAEAAKIQIDSQKKINDFKAKSRKEETQGAFDVAQAGISLLQEVFGKNKAFAIAEVGVNTARGIVNALASSGPPWVGIAMSIIIGALGLAQSAKIAGIEFLRGGMLMKSMARKFGFGGIAASGSILKGPSHAQGGIPFSIGGRPGFEAEGGEAIINKKSTSMFKNELSAINQAGGGVAFSRGGVFASGSILGANQTNQATQAAQSISSVQNAVQSVISNMPPILVTVEDINARMFEYDNNTQKAQVI